MSSIEFYLHPPSPPLPASPEPVSINNDEENTPSLQRNPSISLPSVSVLLNESSPCVSSLDTEHQESLPSLRLPKILSPSSTVDDLPSVPSLTVSIPQDTVSVSPCTSASMSPFPSYFSFDTPQTSPCSPCLSYERVYSSSQTSQQQPQPCFLLPPPVSTRRCRSLSNASTSSQSSVRTFPSLSSTPPILQQRRLSDPPVFHSDLSSFISSHRPHSTSPSPCLSPRIPESCNAPFVTKRKRGRPPNAQRNVSQRDNWTFVTPTVWDVKRKEEEPPQDNKATIPPESSNHQMMVLMWPTEKHATGDEDDNKLQSSNTSLNTFTNTRMDTTLTMPKKKRGRKPKMQLAGNSCFVWRDLTARRGANRKKAAQKMKSKQPTEDPDIDAAVSIQGLTIADKT